GDTPAKCPPIIIADTNAVTLTPVAPEIFGIMGISVGPTTPRVLEKKLIHPATNATTSLAAVALKLSPIQVENSLKSKNKTSEYISKCRMNA
ncbi:MAG TPA: hypothetical protein DHV55_14230, partial [Clostridiaceae bacterium]|nr:hypothetical protein [Clostridiaceae bacterium]